MTTRITGLYSNLDVDSLVEAGVSYYQNKVDKAKQQEQILEWKQEQYRSIQSDVQDFYDDYLTTSGENSLLLSSNWNTNSYASSDSTKVTVSSTSDADIDSYTVSVTSLAKAATTTLTTSQMTGTVYYTVDTNGDGDLSDETEQSIDLSSCSDDDARATLLNSTLNTYGITATASDFSGGIQFTSDEKGSDQTFSLRVGATTKTAKGADLAGTITNSSGIEYALSGTSNTLTLDGVTFNFNGKTNSSGTDSPVTITGTKDVSDLQDKIESFIDDYNTLLTTINGKIYETYDSDYQPLTDAEEADMSESEISSWNTKAQTGLLRQDSYLEDLASGMKSAMSTFLKSAGIDIESIGISAVEDYTTKNGTYSVDSDTLESALEGSITKKDSSTGTTKTITFDDIKNLFTNGYTSITTLTTKSSNSSTDGILSKLKVALNVNATMSTSALAKRAGIEGTTSETTNEITQLLDDQNDLIDELEEKLADKEDALYAKYSTLETNLSKLSSYSSLFSSSSSS